MFAVGAKSSDTAVDGEPGVSATVWFTAGVPVQSGDVKRWKITLPVGAGTPAGAPAIRSTNTLSWTTVPETMVVTTVPDAFRMSVRAVESAQSFDAFALSPGLESAVSRCKVRPPTPTSVLALMVVAPTVVDLMTTLH